MKTRAGTTRYLTLARRSAPFMLFGDALKLTERQVTNALSRFEKNLPKACDLILAGFCKQATKERYRELVMERWSRPG